MLIEQWENVVMKIGVAGLIRRISIPSLGF
jgi:hypothetical protein